MEIEVKFLLLVSYKDIKKQADDYKTLSSAIQILPGKHEIENDATYIICQGKDIGLIINFIYWAGMRNAIESIKEGI
jgi:hypothetical protein